MGGRYDVTVLLSFFVLLASLSSASSFATEPIDQGWMEEGFRVYFRGVAPLSTGGIDDPIHWSKFEAEVVKLNSTVVVLSFSVSRLMAESAGTIEYNLTTRLNKTSGCSTTLFVNDHNVVEGSAWIGCEFASLVSTTAEHHQFTTGGRSYYYDSVTGQLLRAEDLDSGAVVFRSDKIDAKR